jgi:RNA polymerase sigma-70 factor (ECF subfamily)
MTPPGESESKANAAAAGSPFAPTRWTVVLEAGRGDSPRAQDALAQLCQTYWYPLYAYVRRRGYGPHDAEDLTQAFFARLLERNLVAEADRERGRFRTFLLVRLQHFLDDEWDRAEAEKRGGGQRTLSLDGMSAETRYRHEPVDERSPEKLFEYRWAVTVLERVFERLRVEYEAQGKQALFGELKHCLIQARAAGPYADLSGRLGMSEGALRVALHRMRERYRALLREEIAETVCGPDEVEEELRALVRVLAGQG